MTDYEQRVREFGLPVLDYGHVRLDGHMADDWSVVDSARVSFANADRTGIDPERFVNFLMKNRHGTPFESCTFRFHIKLPIFVVREWQRHRAGHSYNEQSGRYSVMEAQWYTPSFIRHQTGKPGSYIFEPVEDEQLREAVRERIDFAAVNSFNAYQSLLDSGIAKEQARLVLPVNTYTSMYWTCNARSLMHWLSLRSAPDAMFEIREYARMVEEVFDWVMPVTAKAFRDHGRVAP